MFSARLWSRRQFLQRILQGGRRWYRRFADNMWRNHTFGYFLLVLFSAICASWSMHLPPPGYAVTAMAVAAGVMALLGNMRGGEKLLWTVLLFLFALTELKAIDKDRTEHEAEQQRVRTQETLAFKTITDGLRQSIAQNQEQFQTTMNRSAKLFARVEESINNTTGGDSFPLVWVGSNNQPNLFPHLDVRGRYPLQDVEVRITDLDSFRNAPWAPPMQYERLYHFPQLLVSRDYPLDELAVTGNQHTYRVVISARNGIWEEFVKVRHIQYKTGVSYWAVAIKLVNTRIGRPTKPSDPAVFEYIDPAYPRGSIDW